MINYVRSSGEFSNTVSFVSPKQKLNAKNLANFIPGGDSSGII